MIVFADIYIFDWSSFLGKMPAVDIIYVPILSIAVTFGSERILLFLTSGFNYSAVQQTGSRKK